LRVCRSEPDHGGGGGCSLPGVPVLLNGYSVATDRQGRFHFPAVEPGSQYLYVGASYRPSRKLVISADLNLYLDRDLTLVYGPILSLTLPKDIS
jgi:hypothetical protein